MASTSIQAIRPFHRLNRSNIIKLCRYTCIRSLSQSGVKLANANSDSEDHIGKKKNHTEEACVTQIQEELRETRVKKFSPVIS